MVIGLYIFSQAHKFTLRKACSHFHQLDSLERKTVTNLKEYVLSILPEKRLEIQKGLTLSKPILNAPLQFVYNRKNMKSFNETRENEACRQRVNSAVAIWSSKSLKRRILPIRN